MGQEVCVLRVVEGGGHEKNCRKRILSSGKSKAQRPEAGKGSGVLEEDEASVASARVGTVG